MEDLDFTTPPGGSPAAKPATPAPPPRPAASPFYDAAITGRVFRALGHAERFAAGQVIFTEDDKAPAGLFARQPGARAYWLEEGEVALTVGGRPLDRLSAGEIFGEMAVLGDRPRSATATAKAPCSAWSLTRDELRATFAKSPEFSLMLMSAMFERLRFVTARLAARHTEMTAREPAAPAFDAPLLAQLEDALPRSVDSRIAGGGLIMREGQSGVVMYVVKSGHVAIAVGRSVVEVAGPGGSFGEMALVDHTPRSASARALEDCELLAIDRAGLVEAVKHHPVIAMALIRSVGDRLRHLNSLLA